MNDMVDAVSLMLSDEELDWCENHAKEIVEYYGGNGTKGSGTYNHNKVSSNLVGVKCEVGTVNWLRENGVDEERILKNFIHFRDKTLNGDIVVNMEVHVAPNEILEVKGLRPHQWSRFKRMIPPNQLNVCVRNDAILIWGIATGDKKNSEVKLMGWNHAYEVKEFGKKVRTICDNVWLEEDSLMRPMETLLEMIKGE
jgi:hypothetical protein